MLEDFIFYVILLLFACAISYLVGRIVTEIADFSEEKKVKWEQTRNRGKWRFTLPPSIITAVVYVCLMTLARPLFKRQRTITDLLISGGFYAAVMFTGYLAVWRTNELKFQGKIPAQWKRRKETL